MLGGPLSAEDEAREQAERNRRFAIETKSPYHCIVCCTYVGHDHSLKLRAEDCRLGNELTEEEIKELTA